MERMVLSYSLCRYDRLLFLETGEDNDERCRFCGGLFPRTIRGCCPTSDLILESLSLPQRRCLGTFPGKSA